MGIDSAVESYQSRLHRFYACRRCQLHRKNYAYAAPPPPPSDGLYARMLQEEESETAAKEEAACEADEELRRFRSVFHNSPPALVTYDFSVGPTPLETSFIPVTR